MARQTPPARQKPPEAAWELLYLIPQVWPICTGVWEEQFAFGHFTTLCGQQRSNPCPVGSSQEPCREDLGFHWDSTWPPHLFCWPAPPGHNDLPKTIPVLLLHLLNTCMGKAAPSIPLSAAQPAKSWALKGNKKWKCWCFRFGWLGSFFPLLSAGSSL